jgi:heme exporter protein B
MSGPFLALLARDLRLALRQGSDTAIVLAFFVIVASLFTFGVGPEPGRLSEIGAGIVWVAALLAALLSLDRLFQADYEDGTLDYLLTAPIAPTLLVAAKCLAHWLTTGLPVILLAPLLALLLRLDPAGYPVLVGGLALGTPILTLLGAIGAALVLGARRGGVLLSLLILPLYVPILIFGVAAVDAAIAQAMAEAAAVGGQVHATGPGARPHLLLLAALLLAAMALAPFVTALALRQAAE